jgi:hypothetical protein
VVTLAQRICIYDIAQQKCILRRYDRIVNGGHGQPEVLQRLADLNARRIRDIDDILVAHLEFGRQKVAFGIESSLRDFVDSRYK